MGNVGQHYYKWRYSNPTPPASGTVNITISNYTFNPDTLTITAGTKVVWTNQDTVSHTITNDSKIFGSGFLAKGNTYEFTFDQPGTYDYHCTPHPFMRGKIIVI
jgi:amicyanin